jgi:hypothetical protein
MSREEYIEKLLAIYKLKYKPGEVEIEEFRLMLEMMPDRPVLYIPNNPASPITTPSPIPWSDTPVMYGVSMPYTTTGKE